MPSTTMISRAAAAATAGLFLASISGSAMAAPMASTINAVGSSVSATYGSPTVADVTNTGSNNNWAKDSQPRARRQTFQCEELCTLSTGESSGLACM